MKSGKAFEIEVVSFMKFDAELKDLVEKAYQARSAFLSYPELGIMMDVLDIAFIAPSDKVIKDNTNA